MELGTAIVHALAVATALGIGFRRRGWAGVAVVAAVMAVVIRGFGQLVLVQPWNPYLPVLMWVVVLLALWGVLDGDTWLLVPLVVAASFCAQTHVPYLPLGVGAVAVGRGRGGMALVADPAGVRRGGRHSRLGRSSPRSRPAWWPGCRPSSTRSAIGRATSACCSSTSPRRRKRRLGSAKASDWRSTTSMRGRASSDSSPAPPASSARPRPSEVWSR